MFTLRAFAMTAPVLLSACAADSESYDAAVARTWKLGALDGLSGLDLQRELVRCATLAPSSHNTQCWKFSPQERAIAILPDLSRRCPAVDPDDHHLFVSLGCAAENLAQAALADALAVEPRFDAGSDTLRIALAPTTAALDQALDFIVQANTAQMIDKAFVAELKSWTRFSSSDAVRRGDDLYSASTGNPTLPSWLGRLIVDFVFRPKSENDKNARQVRSSAGIAVFVGPSNDKANWIEVGSAYERFALQATALGVRTAHLNQPREVTAWRPQFANFVGMPGQRPDLVVRFGRGPTLPPSLRRPVHAVLV